jgi:hypothetical protein
MTTRLLLYIGVLLTTGFGLATLSLGAFASVAADPTRSKITHGAEISETLPLLLNASFECAVGYYTQTNPLSETLYIPNDWSLAVITGAPVVHSARLFFAGACAENGRHVERIDGLDSITARAQDLETPPAPGKPFDVAFYQQTTAITGVAYSLSGWLLTLCGGSATPSDCPDDVYIAKMLGVDPTGGVDPLAESVLWAENRDNFVDNKNKFIGWANLRLGVVAEAMTLTVFARLSSPFQWHGNHGFIDALSLARAPTATLTSLPAVVTGTRQLTLTWTGAQSADAQAIPGGTYQLLFDIQYRRAEAAEWQEMVVGHVGEGSILFTANCVDTAYHFRIRARAEQPPAPPEGAWPNHRYPGVWSEPAAVRFAVSPTATMPITGDHQLYLPLIANEPQC